MANGMNDVTVVGNVNITIDITERMVSDILISALDNPYGGSRYWVQNVRIKGNDAEDILDEIWYSATFEDSYGDHNPKYFVNAEKVVAAIQNILSNNITVSPVICDTLSKAIRENDAGYVDADVADVILQVAVLGEIVYG